MIEYRRRMSDIEAAELDSKAAYCKFHDPQPVLEIEAIKRLRLRPGDTIVLKTKFRLSEQKIDILKQTIERNYPGHKALVLEEGMDIEVLSKED